MMSELPHAEEVISISDSEALRNLLERNGFNTSLWGVGPTKSVDALWEEIDSGETEIIESGQKIIRRTHVVGVDVLINLGDNKTYKLVEEKQVFANGAERRRGLITSIGEKIKPYEDTETAVRRAIAEELGITSLKHVDIAGHQILEKDSATYNGLTTQLLLRLAKVIIAESDYIAEGYTEVQPDKTTYFAWQPLSEARNKVE